MEENREFNEQNQTEKKSKKGFYLKIIALALCCAILGGIVGGGVVFVAGNAMAERELSDILDDGHFAFRGRFNLWSPFVFSFGATKDIVEGDFFKESYIGVSVSDSSDPEGALLNSVEKGGPAAKGGLKDNDIITMINNRKIDDSDDLADYIADSDVGDEMLFTVYRNGETIECTVIVGEHSRFGK